MGSASLCQMFSDRPNLLERETYPTAKLRKIPENRRDNEIYL